MTLKTKVLAGVAFICLILTIYMIARDIFRKQADDQNVPCCQVVPEAMGTNC